MYNQRPINGIQETISIKNNLNAPTSTVKSIGLYEDKKYYLIDPISGKTAGELVFPKNKSNLSDLIMGDQLHLVKDNNAYLVYFIKWNGSKIPIYYRDLSAQNKSNNLKKSKNGRI